MNRIIKNSIAAALLLLSLPSIAQTAKTTTEWGVYKDTAYNISMEYPTSWQLKPPSGNARFFVTSYPESEADLFRENVNCITPSSVNKGATIEEAAKDIDETLAKSLPDFKVIHSGYSQWNGHKAYEIDYTCTQTAGDKTYYLHMMQKVVIINDKLYALTFTSLADAYDKYIAAAKRMFGSFKVK